MVRSLDTLSRLGILPISIAMHEPNTVQEKPMLIMCDTNTYFYVMQLTLNCVSANIGNGYNVLNTSYNVLVKCDKQFYHRTL